MREHAGDMLLFAQVVDARSFSRAAERLGMSRPVLSKAVARLEDRLGVRLLNRTTRRLSLTEAGRLLYARCADIAEAVRDAESLVQDLKARPWGDLKVSAPILLGQLLTPYLMDELLAEHPDLRLYLELTDDYVDVVGGGYDAVVRVGTLGPSSLVARKVGRTRLVACATPGYFAAHGVPRDPEDLLAHRCITLAAEGGDPRPWQFDSHQGPRTVRVSGPFVSNNDSAIKQALLSGRGLGYVPTFMVAQEVRDGLLALALEPYCRREQGIYVLYPHHRHLPLKVRAFVDFVARTVAALDLPA